MTRFAGAIGWHPNYHRIRFARYIRLWVSDGAGWSSGTLLQRSGARWRYWNQEDRFVQYTQVEAQVSDYVGWYGIHSIFIDDVENVHGYEQYYTSLSNYAHANGVSFVLGNPGTNVTASHIGIFDNIGTYENSGAPRSR